MTISRRFAVLLGLVILVAVGWSLTWSVMAERFADGLSRTVFSEKKGQVHCQSRSTTGFPFRFSERCDAAFLSGSNRPDLPKAHFAGLTLTALPYQPQRAIVEAEGPLDLAMITGASTLLRWETARASLRHDFAEITRFDAELIAAQLDAMPVGSWSLARGALHMRQTPGNPFGADLSFRLTGLQPIQVDDSDALDFLATFSATPATSLHRGEVDGLLAEWQQSERVDLEVTQVSLALGDSRLSANGHLVVDQAGLLSGDLSLEVRHAGDLLAQLSAHYLPADLTADLGNNKLALAFLGAGSSAQTTDSNAPPLSVTLSIDKGDIKLGFFTLGTLPSLYR